MTIAVLLPIFNGLAHTQVALFHLTQALKYTGEEEHCFRIIIIDDGSTDGSSAWIAEHYPQMVLLAGTGELWWSGAMSLGASYALTHLDVDYVVLWNNDIRCEKAYFRNLLGILRESGASTLLGSKVYLLDRPSTLFAVGCYFNPHTGYHTLIGTGETDSAKYQQVIVADWCGGMGTVIHRSVFSKIGLWNARLFPQYHGDSDFGLRAKKAGIRLEIRPELKLWNDKSSSGLHHGDSLVGLVNSLLSKKSNYQLASQWRFYWCHAESVWAYHALLRFYGGYAGGFMKWKVLGLIGKQRPSGRD